MNRVSIWLVGLVGGAALLLAITLISMQSNGSWLARRGPQAPPRITVSVVVDGRSLTDDFVTVVRGSRIVPSVSVTTTDGSTPTIALTLGGREVEAGQPISLDRRGYYTLKAKSVGGGLPGHDLMTIEVADRPRYTPALAIERAHVERTEDGGAITDVELRLSSTEFGIRSIYLSHVQLWLLDDENQTVGTLSLADVADDGSSPNARWDDAGQWVMRFRGRVGEAPLKTLPTRLWITGSGWKGTDRFDYSTTPIPLTSTSAD